ncbi:2-amino-4-hydroxy-6-hydroxymethyldihydropteridine diphosphokinase [Mucilaginibacter conchicola]|uniref:2-amino-4-hydroxy-6-hydroxymethyldihydropteridine pyrophosphokinase n=1 Tax=Mucilaginibacter conchicola TaxID=2303333 RepID=A0A372NY25_9SPHI|nr:2-amino-4-hydroxy-6-hydroxymethyldihydropteridine diphosphokinase [Mucilaginibacter conchicola]RFZ95023.1 2-amino-4-hydroxy-6-hydroxymethyldihydropteridine diphosphokinase [Mucilaginibacter conchicola]
MIDVFLLLGSNLGNRKLFLDRAIDSISAQVAPVVKASGVYETQSWGKTDEPDYLNQVLLLKTDMPAKVLLHKVLAIEQELGRVREERWGSRVIDIDILFYGDTIIDEPDLKIPHPQLHNRRFTLEPLVELTPDLLHPVLRKNMLQLKTELSDSLIVKKVYF